MGRMVAERVDLLALAIGFAIAGLFCGIAGGLFAAAGQSVDGGAQQRVEAYVSFGVAGPNTSIAPRRRRAAAA